jgi:hypothetical protein
MPTHHELAEKMQRICEWGVDPAAVLRDTEERIRQANLWRAARNCNPEWVALGFPPRYEGPAEQRAFRPVHPFGVATRTAWHACVAYGNTSMRMEGIVNPTRVLPKPFVEVPIAKQVEVQGRHRRHGVARRVHERILFGNHELFCNARLLELAT